MTQSTPSGQRSKPRFKPFFVIFGIVFISVVLLALLGKIVPLASKTVNISMCDTGPPTLQVQRYQIYGQSTKVYGDGSYPYSYGEFKALHEGSPQTKQALDCGALLGGKAVKTKLQATLYLW